MDEIPRVFDDSRFTWSEVDPGFYVGSFAGNFIGYVDHTLGEDFYAYDMKSQLAGQFESLDAAMVRLADNFLPTSEIVVYP